MHALRILVTPPSTSSSPPSVIYPSASSTSTEELSSSSTEINTIGAEEPRDIVKPLPPVPPEDVPRPAFQRRGTNTTTATSASIRSADDLLTQVGVLRDSANAARERRARFRGPRTAYDRSNDGNPSNGIRTRRYASRLTCGPMPSHEAKPTQVQINTQRNNKASVPEKSSVNPVLVAGGPNDARRVQLRCLTPDSTSSADTWTSAEKPSEKRGNILRAPASFIKRFLCFGDFSCTGQYQLHSPGPAHRADSLTSNARFDSLLHREPHTTRRIYLRPRSSIIPPRVLDIRMRPHSIRNECSLLERLPVELIYEIQLCALSESLPVVNRPAHGTFKSTHATYRAEYLFLRYISSASDSMCSSYTRSELVTYALRYPLCTEEVLDALLRRVARNQPTLDKGPRPLLPKRLFKSLGPRPPSSPYYPTSAPLPFLYYLYTNPQIHPRPPDPNAHDGYALCRAVHAGFMDLVRFLLRQGAKPGLKEALAVRIAVKKRDLGLVRTLIERDAEDEFETVTSEACPDHVQSAAVGSHAREADMKRRRRKSAKRRRVEDRVEVTTAMLRLAVETDARDIVQYFLEKGARPDLSTIQRMRRIGFV
ncbi:hypothetical protein ACEPAF_8032 [Sanghuangporus sanghuang]